MAAFPGSAGKLAAIKITFPQPGLWNHKEDAVTGLD
jgi:hypothetical protein